jgi:hypothetical protein
LTNVEWHDSITSVGNYAFDGCKKLKEVYLPSVISVGYSSFENCSEMTKFTGSLNLVTIGERAFKGCTVLKTVTGTESVTSIGNYAFQDCKNLISINLESALAVNFDAFEGCSSLTNVVLSNDLTSIGVYAFNGCSSLTDITIGDNVTEIGAGAFGGVSSLKTNLTTDNQVAKDYDWSGSGRYFYDLKVYDKYDDAEPTLREWVKISDYAGKSYEYLAQEKTNYELTSDYRVTGTATKDTDIIFTYELIKYNVKVYDVFNSFKGYDDNGSAIWETEKQERVNEKQKIYTTYSYDALDMEGYELTSEKSNYKGTVLGDVEITFTYKYNGSIPKLILTINDDFYDANGNLESTVTRSSDEYEKPTNITVKALTTAELAKANKSSYVLGNDEQDQTSVYVNSSQTVTFKYYRQPSVIEVDADTDTTAPQLKEYNISMNLYKETLPTIELTNGSEYTLKNCEIIDAKGNKSGFRLTKISDSQLELGIDAGYTKKIKAGNTYNLYLQVTTNENKADIYNIPIVIEVVKEKPTVTVTQGDILNLYDKDGTGTLIITSSAEISDIDFISKAKSGAVRLEQDTTNTAITDTTAVFKYILADGNASNFAKANAGGKLTVKFEGYKDEAAYTSNITLKVNKTLPKLTLEAMTLYTGTANDTADVKIIDSTTGKDVTDEYDIEQTGKVPAKYSIDGSSVTADTGAKNATIKWNITHDNWYGTTAASLKVTVKTKPVLTFSNTKAVLNVNGSPIEITPQIAGINDSAITVESIVGKDKNSKSALDNGLSLTADKGKITVKVDKSKYTATGTKKYNFTVTASTSDFEDITATLSISVTNAATDVTIKSTGKLDLLDRTGSSIAYKFTVKNNISDIENVELTNYTDKFNLAYTNGTATLTAIQGASLEVRTAKNPYVLTFKITLANGDVTSKTVNVTPTQNAPALVGTKATFYKNATGSKYAKTISITGKSTAVDITNITLTDSYNGAFVYTYDNGGNGTLYINKTKAANLKFKSYSLKFQVTLKDSGAPITVTIPVKYSK